MKNLPGRVDAWRIAGNAIVPQLAAEVLAALMDTLDDRARCVWTQEPQGW